MKLTHLQQLTAGNLLGADINFDTVSTDTRSLQRGDLFFALQGENFDAHKFVSSAIAKGACAVVVSQAQQDIPVPQLVVADVCKALGCAGKISRNEFPGRVFGITGSNGKTTVKGMLTSILSEMGLVTATEGNFNNQIGVPLTLMKLSANHDFAVVEAGTSYPGEIPYLTQLIQPNIALVNNVMAAHLLGFGSELAIAQEKAQIYVSEQLNAGVVNLTDSYSAIYMKALEGKRIIGFGVCEDASQLESFKQQFTSAVDVLVCALIGERDNFDRYEFALFNNDEQVDVLLAVPGKHNVSNAVAAAACALAVDVSCEDIANGLRAFTGVPGRMQFANTMLCKLLVNDTYNANPGSMRAAIDFLANYENTILIAGDMGEIGEREVAEHRAVGAYAKTQGIGALWGVGTLCRHMVTEFGDAGQWFADQQALFAFLQEQQLDNNVVLIKGSRSARMEKVVHRLETIVRYD